MQKDIPFKEIFKDTIRTYPYQSIIVLLVILGIMSLLCFLGSTPFNTRGEPREAVVAMSMLQQHDWILPLNNGTDIPYKPPFMHWCIALVSRFSGSVTEWTSRFPSALSLLLLMGGLYAVVRRGGNKWVALLSVGLLYGSFEVHRAAMACRVDMMLSACMAGSLLCLYRWERRGFADTPLLAYVLLALSALTKGPVGPLLPAFAFVVYLFLRGYGLKQMLLVGLLALGSFAPLLGWYYLAYCSPNGGQAFLDLVYEENVLRLLGKMSYESHVNPWYYNVMTLVAGWMPWTFFLLVVLCCRLRRHHIAHFRQLVSRHPLNRKSTWTGFREALRKAYSLDVLAATSAIVIFLFFCVPASKRSVYLLPMYPFVAYLTARCIYWAWERSMRVAMNFMYAMMALCAVLVLAFVVLYIDVIPHNMLLKNLDELNFDVLEMIASNSLQIAIVLLVLIYVTYTYFFTYGYRRRIPRTDARNSRIFALIFPVLSIYFLADSYVLPLVGMAKTDKYMAQTVKENVKGPYYSYRKENCAANPLHPFTVNFYLGNRVSPLDTTKCSDGVVFTSEDCLDDLQRFFPDREVRELRYLYRPRSCDDRRPMHVYEVREPFDPYRVELPYFPRRR